MFNDPQFWVFIAFIIFVGIIFNPVRKMLTANLDTKIEEIRNSIDQAEKLKKEAQITLSEIKKRQNEVKNEINLIQKEANKKIAMIETNAKAKLDEQINKRNVLASVKIDQMTRDANADIQQHIIQTAIVATVNILKKKLNNEEKQNLIKQSIKDLNLVFKN